MAFDGVGNFTRLYNWVTDAANALKIQAARMDGEFDNYATAMNLTFIRDGRAAMTGDLKLGNFRALGANAGTVASPSFQFTAGTNTGVYMPTAGELGLVANGVEQLRLSSTAATVTQQLILTAGQLAFPAAQNASAGANVLDDYEEGTWTPTLTFGGAAVGMTGTFSGDYTKIGRLLTTRCGIVLSAKGSSVGSARIGGLPFSTSGNPSPTQYASAGAVAYVSGLAAIAGQIVVSQGNSGQGTVLDIMQGTTADALLTEANFTNASNLFFTFTGFTA